VARRAAESFTPPNRLLVVVGLRLSGDEVDLLESFNERLRDLHQSGEWLKIVKQFGLAEDDLPSPSLTTEDACGG
jgi:ABC-type amino acid transport substrate-binding protein